MQPIDRNVDLDGNNRPVGMCICGQFHGDAISADRCQHFINHMSIHATSGRDGDHVIVECGACHTLWRYLKGNEVEYRLYTGFVDLRRVVP